MTVGEDRPAPTNEELRAHHVLVPGDTGGWQRRARLLQAQWRERIGYPIGPWPTRGGEVRVLGSRMPLPDARAGRWNFLTATIAEQVELTLQNRQEGALINQDRLFGDLLSSQPLAFNAFGELAADHELATAVWNRLLHPDATVTCVQFEWSPSRTDRLYTGTKSAFDVIVEYRLPDGGCGFTGVEVKYHEDLRKSPKPGSVPNARCVELTSAAFPGADVDALWRAPVWQLWLDDLLARSLLEVGEYSTGEFVVLAPSANTACREAVNAYNELIAPQAIRLITLEEFLAAAAEETHSSWVAQLSERYLGTASG